jgi:sensor histidine kinase YesM
MLHRLSDFLRMTLEDTGQQEIPLRRELAFAACYIEIEKTRFPGRIDYRAEVEAATLDLAVPNLFLQPLLENAVRHAVDQGKGRGRIEIHCRRLGDRLCLTLLDDGPGIPAGVQQDRQDEGLSGGSGLSIGIANVRERLQQLYGEAHSLEFLNRAEKGFEVSIEIPCRRIDETTVDSLEHPWAIDAATSPQE